MQPDFWQDQERAVGVTKHLEELSNEVEEWDDLLRQTSDLLSLITEANQEQDNSMEQEFAHKLLELQQVFSKLEFFVLFDEPHDQRSVWLAIHAGTGGVDAQDWAQMLQRMYLRFAEHQGWSAEILEQNQGQEAGLKNCLIKITGRWAYGHLKSEAGVHRLVRISPFDAEAMRQTSFALVEVWPELPKDEAVDIREEDLKIDFFRSSGPGGQNVNKTSSAVRLTHVPTGLIVSSQTERSQHQNRANALAILQAKLYQQQQAQQQQEQKDIRGEVQTAEWGKQIRSYVLQPYKMVKDHRTNYETSNVGAVLDGKIEDFIISYLKMQKQR